jgi:hypothetical protein
MWQFSAKSAQSRPTPASLSWWHSSQTPLTFSGDVLIPKVVGSGGECEKERALQRVHDAFTEKGKRAHLQVTRLTCQKNDTPSSHHLTMFKRVDRRRKRKENEERLGLDEDQWGVFGLHHTDSSESESSDSASTSSSDADGHSTKKRKRGASPPSYDENSDSEEDGESEPAIDDEEDEEGSNDHGNLTIASALKEPIRPIEPHSEAWMCVLCPGKTLKHATMVKVHETSRVRRPQSQRGHCTNFHHRFTSGVSSACKSSQWILVRKKTSKTFLKNQRQKHSLKRAKLFCPLGRKRGCVETPHAFVFRMDTYSYAVRSESQTGKIEGET